MGADGWAHVQASRQQCALPDGPPTKYPAQAKRVKHDNENTCSPGLIGWDKEVAETQPTRT